jgi:leucyl/phenylalanyl-tRNA--protein transferase
MDVPLTPRVLLTAYANGIFPMADDAGEVHWLAPDPRAILPLDAFTVSRSLRSLYRRCVFEIRVDSAFGEVIQACAARADGTWISSEIIAAYRRLHELGFAHSVEAWQEDRLAGGLYGVSLGGAFFGESMFHRVSNASKVALVALVERMRKRGFRLLDVQFMTEHLRQFGAIEISRKAYEKKLAEAVQLRTAFVDSAGEMPGADNEQSRGE